MHHDLLILQFLVAYTQAIVICLCLSFICLLVKNIFYCSPATILLFYLGIDISCEMIMEKFQKIIHCQFSAFYPYPNKIVVAECRKFAVHNSQNFSLQSFYILLIESIFYIPQSVTRLWLCLRLLLLRLSSAGS